MRLGLWKYAPAILGSLLILVLSLLLLFGRWLPGFQFIERLEWISYDWRVRLALEHDQSTSNDFGVVEIDEKSLAELNRTRGYQWPLPRMLFAQVLRELNAQGAAGVMFDVFFLDVDEPQTQLRVPLVNGGSITSDDFFARTLQESPGAILTSPTGVGRNLALPADLFRRNAHALGHAVRSIDDDGVMRRVRPFVDDPVSGRVWQGGILLASTKLNLKLTEALVTSESITIPKEQGGQVTIPLDHNGNMLVNWSLPYRDKRLVTRNLLSMLGTSARRAKGGEVPNVWKDRLVVIGSTGVGSNIRDMGATPLERETFLTSTFWNVANSMITGQFIRESSTPLQVSLLAAFTALSGFVSWRLRAMFATLAVAVLAALYVTLVVWIFVCFRLVLPVVLPAAGALLMTHGTMVAFRMVLERGHRRRVRSLFQHIVSPNIMDLIIEQPDPTFGTQKREMTVMFADIRGFTDYTDRQRANAEREIQQYGLLGTEADACHDRYANAAMETVNLYLSIIVDAVKKHDGTLDKYIGDCVMAFWGAPLSNPHHAEAAVLAAVDAQRAVAAFNAQRGNENERITIENKVRERRGELPLSLLPLLTIGIGINSGTMTVGFMGSSKHLSNYTVFGREVNIAARLESAAGSQRIVVSAATLSSVKGVSPQSPASKGTKSFEVQVKGIAETLTVFEVSWEPT
ncbi:MAG: adenylate/guanylate cyclase domain-containing protein [Verrucomicrobiaceae bacterium]